jgi:methionyl-tRNA formyltransferase
MTNNNLKIGVLCNNPMAIPALHRLAAAGVMCFIASADNNADSQKQIMDTAHQLGAPYHKIVHSNKQIVLQDLLETKRPDGLLPQMRGADPIFESIRQRKAEAGATVHKMDQGLDTGPIVLKEQIPLPPEYTYGMLSSQMAWLGDKMCQQLLPMLQTGQVPAAIQQESEACYWPKIDERQLPVRWAQQSREDIIALVRACNPIAKGVPVTVNNWKFGICDISEVNLQGDASAVVPGTILACDQQNGLVVCCKEGKAVKLEVVYSAEGVFPGYKLGFFGIQPGMVFTDP